MIKMLSVKNKYVYLVLLILIFCLFFFTRLYRFQEISAFVGDQGNDLLIAYKILHEGHRPLVGPVLGIEGFYTPPTYYYLLALFFWIGKSPEGTALFFFLFNLFSLIALFIASTLLIDKYAGLLTLLLFTISENLVNAGRSMWNPHLTISFLCISLACLAIAYVKKNNAFTLLSLFLYLISLSIYPSPIIISFYFIYQTIKVFLLNDKSRNKLISAFKISCFGLFISGIIYAPQIIFSVNNHYPTLNSVYRSLIEAKQVPTVGFKSVSLSISELFSVFAGTTSFINSNHEALALTFAALMLILYIYLKTFTTSLVSDKARKFCFQSFHPLAADILLLAGLTPIWFYRQDVYFHRLWAFVPIFIVLFAYVIRLISIIKYNLVKILLFGILGFYLLGNGLDIYTMLKHKVFNDISRTKKIADFIINDIKFQNHDLRNITVLTYEPNDYDNYQLPPYLFFLKETIDFDIGLTTAGNDLLREKINHNPNQNTYLICQKYSSYTDAVNLCLNRFQQQNTDYLLVQQKIFENNYWLFILKKINQFSRT